MADKKISELDVINGADTAADDFFVVVDTSGSVTKKISRAELNNAIEQDVLAQVDITSANIDGGTIDNTPIGSTTASTGNFTTVDTTGNVTVGGNLTVNGTTTTVNSTTLDVDDINITVASGAANAAAADGAGLTVDGASATFNYASTGDKWTMNKPLDVAGTVTADGLTVDTNADTSIGANSDGATTVNFKTNRSSANATMTNIASQWNGTTVAQVRFETGSDTTNKDDGRISFRTSESGGSVKLRQLIENNGDISFYDSTGVTQGFFWDASTQRLGLGTTAPATPIHTYSTSTAINRFEVGSASDSGVRVMNTAGDYSIYTAGGSLRFADNNASEVMRFSSGNVGIGTASPATNAEISSAINTTVRITSTNNFTSWAGNHFGALEFYANDGSGAGAGVRSAIRSSATSNDGGYANLVFSNTVGAVNDVEVGRWDASGNLLVGKTSTGGGTTEGTEIHSDGYTQIVRDSFSNNPVVYLGKLNNDGEIVRLTKDGTTVGSIGTDSGNLYVEGSTSASKTGIEFRGSTILPRDSGALTDGSTNLGSSGNRWQDAYFSGEVQAQFFTGNGDTDTYMDISSNPANTIKFYTGGSERARVDASGNFLIGTTATVTDATMASGAVGIDLRGSADVIIASRDGGHAFVANRQTSDGDLMLFKKAGTTVGAIGTSGGDLIVGTDDTGLRFRDIVDAIIPFSIAGGVGNDNALDLGESGTRFDDIYATNGTIQTSDANEKQDIEALSDAEQRVAVAAKGLLRKYRWKSSVEEKGDDARIHFGIIAQDLQAAFEAEGLDAGRYAMFINSEWTDEETGEQKSRMGIRYNQLLAFIIAAI